MRSSALRGGSDYHERHTDLGGAEQPPWALGLVGGWVVEVPQGRRHLNWVLRGGSYEGKRRRGNDGWREGDLGTVTRVDRGSGLGRSRACWMARGMRDGGGKEASPFFVLVALPVNIEFICC